MQPHLSVIYLNTVFKPLLVREVPRLKRAGVDCYLLQQDGTETMPETLVLGVKMKGSEVDQQLVIGTDQSSIRPTLEWHRVGNEDDSRHTLRYTTDPKILMPIVERFLDDVVPVRSSQDLGPMGD